MSKVIKSYIFLSLFLVCVTVHARYVSTDKEDLVVGVVKMPGIVDFTNDAGSLKGLLPKMIMPVFKKAGYNLVYDSAGLEEAFSGEHDVILGGINDTLERSKKMHFSTGYYTASLGIMQKNDFDIAWYQYVTIVAKEMFVPILILIVSALIFGHLLWWRERGEGEIARKYNEGIGDAIWESFKFGTSLSDFETKDWVSRSVLFVDYLVVLLVVAFILTASNSAVSSLDNHKLIRSASALSEATVAVKQGSANVSVVESLGGKVVLVKSLVEASILIRRGVVEVAVFDKIQITHFLQNNKEFATSEYGFNTKTYHVVVSEKYKGLLPEINEQILRVRETDEYRMYCGFYLHEKCYG